MAFNWSISGYLSIDCTLRVFDACFIDMLIMMIDYLDGAFDAAIFFLCFIVIFVWDIDMLIILIGHLALLSIVILILTMIVLIASHVWIHYCISFDLRDWSSCLYIILIVFEHDVCITIHLDCHSLYVDMSGIFVLCLIVCCMTALFLSIWVVISSIKPKILNIKWNVGKRIWHLLDNMFGNNSKK